MPCRVPAGCHIPRPSSPNQALHKCDYPNYSSHARNCDLASRSNLCSFFNPISNSNRHYPNHPSA